MLRPSTLARLRTSAVLTAGIAALSGSVLGGCSGESTDSEGSSPCDGSAATVDGYVAGLAKPGKAGTMTFTLKDALPAPPGRGTNRWVVALGDSAGAPLAGATFTSVKPWMPDHGHGSGSKPTVTVDASGEATIEALEFVMPGVWTVTLAAEQGASQDEATFGFCIDG